MPCASRRATRPSYPTAAPSAASSTTSTWCCAINTHTDTYSNYVYYASNANEDNEFNIETYIKCGKYKVSRKDGEDILQYLGPYYPTLVGNIQCNGATGKG